MTERHGCKKYWIERNTERCSRFALEPNPFSADNVLSEVKEKVIIPLVQKSVSPNCKRTTGRLRV